MASTPLGAESALVIHPRLLPAPPPAITRVLARYSRNELASFIAVAIDLMDMAEGDCDLEHNGDEFDGNGAEDEFCKFAGDGPGCPIADPDAACDDVPCDEPHQDREPDHPDHLAYGLDQSKGPLPPHLAEDRAIARPHLHRIRREACDRVVSRFGDVDYRLRTSGEETGR